MLLGILTDEIAHGGAIVDDTDGGGQGGLRRDVHAIHIYSDLWTQIRARPVIWSLHLCNIEWEAVDLVPKGLAPDAPRPLYAPTIHSFEWVAPS